MCGGKDQVARWEARQRRRQRAAGLLAVAALTIAGFGVTSPSRAWMLTLSAVAFVVLVAALYVGIAELPPEC